MRAERSALGLPPLRVLVVGQVPPPMGGQALMTRTLLSGEYEGVELLHVPMRLSDSLGEMGRIRLRKVLGLLAVAVRVARLALRARPDVLYYVPAPPATAPILRDLALLNLIRGWFRYTIFHFHAGGVADFESQLPRLLRPAFRRAYRRPDVAIRTSHGAPEDGIGLSAHATYVIPNGIPDPRPDASGPFASPDPPRILYVGLVSREKGIHVLLEACRRLRAAGVRFHVDIVGPFADSRVEREVRSATRGGPLSGVLSVHGSATGSRKWAFFRSATLLCFPSSHPSETFGLVMVEALAFGLPVVASRRRGAPHIIDDHRTGRLFEPDDSDDLADCLHELLVSTPGRERIARRARENYERRFTERHFREGMQGIFDDLSRRAAAEDAR